MKEIAKSALAKSQSYQAYRQEIDALLAQGKTTGDKHSEDFVHYTQLNATRMKRLDQKVKLLPSVLERLENYEQALTWLVLTEAWCGDAAQIIPVLAKMAAAAPHIELRTLLRDEHLDLMDAFLTDGGRAIPKVIVLNQETREVLGSWGPRPVEAQRKVTDFKLLKEEHPELADFDEFRIELQQWYNKDKSHSTQREALLELLP